MSLDNQLTLLIKSCPSHIQRHFACDCAERTLLRTGVENEILWNTIKVSRRFAEGEATIDELSAARVAAQDVEWVAAHDMAQDVAWVAAKDGAWDAACAAAWVAQRVAVWVAPQDAKDAAQDEEREWQLAHLQSLIAAHNAARSSLLHSLQQRAESIKPIFAQYAHALEERAFE